MHVWPELACKQSLVERREEGGAEKSLQAEGRGLCHSWEVEVRPLTL